MSGDEVVMEPPRPEPEFRVYVVHNRNPDSMVEVTHAVMDVYDIAVGSMDFGSGFLSTEEVGNLRALGAAIGAERFDYQEDKCLRCGHTYKFHCRAARCNYYPVGSGDCQCVSYVRAEGTVL